MNEYVHGYSERESTRLLDQASTLFDFLYADLVFPSGARVLEAGCGTGAQTIHLAGQNPLARIVALDISKPSLLAARKAVADAGFGNVCFGSADLYHLPVKPGSIDHAFVCFVLEHLQDPSAMLAECLRALKPGGRLTVIEGDHGTYCCHPKSVAADRCVQSLIQAQAHTGGDALIGRRLYPLLCDTGFENVCVSPRMIYVDGRRPDLAEGFTRNTFSAMVEGVREAALRLGVIEASTFDRGVRDLYRAAEPDGTFCYTFFRAEAVCPG